jgi:hypothetical protein
MRDRLRAVECPMDMIDRIGGCRDQLVVSGLGMGRGMGLNIHERS